MKFDDLDKSLRIYETINDQYALPGVYLVARIDGRCFTRLTKEVHEFDAPYDVIFRDMMIETTKHLMVCGFNIVYGYTQSDEISLLFHIEDATFDRKIRKLNSILAAEASAKFSLLLGDVATFDCRICQLPTKTIVRDYFRWRNEDANRNALNSHCYWMLRKQGVNAEKATEALSGKSVADKNELLFQKGINFNELPNWQKRGIGVYWQEYDKEGYNPIKKEIVFVKRTQLYAELDLPMKDRYSKYVEQIVTNMFKAD
ncbi:MAG: guanylyltransferase [Phycisphaerae bacterium]|nr:guanylyltransferase [Phycisphaerae bacterium]